MASLHISFPEVPESHGMLSDFSSDSGVLFVEFIFWSLMTAQKGVGRKTLLEKQLINTLGISCINSHF